MPILTSKEFREFIEARYKMASNDMMINDMDQVAIDEEFENASEV
jgi:hypothetical protein